MINSRAANYMNQALALLILFCSVSISSAQSSAPTKEDFLAANMDPSINPGVDFFTYANGGWLARHPIPPSESSWGIGKLVNEELYARLRKINEEAAASQQSPGSSQQQIGDFWSTAMNESQADSLGLAPLNPTLALIDSIKTVPDVLDVTFALDPIGVGAFCGVSVSQDEKKSDLMSVHLIRGAASACLIATSTSTPRKASRKSARNTSPISPGMLNFLGRSR